MSAHIFDPADATSETQHTQGDLPDCMAHCDYPLNFLKSFRVTFSFLVMTFCHDHD